MAIVPRLCSSYQTTTGDSMNTPPPRQREARQWDTRQQEKRRRLESVRHLCDGRILGTDAIVDALQLLVASGDRVVLEGNNQKQADFLARALVGLDAGKVNGLHMIMPSVSLPQHLDLFERGIANKLDFAFAGAQSLRISQLLQDGVLQVGALHTYVELYARLYVDLVPNVVLVAGYKADRDGNLYTGPSTEDTPALVEAAAFRDGIVIAQVNEIVDDPAGLPRVDIPGSWIDFVVRADKPFYIEPLFTRDPRLIKPVHVLMAMMAIRGVYERHNVQSLNHGIGFNTAAIELLLPTYGEQLGLKGRICRNWTLNPHPTLIPAIESGWVDSVHCFGAELGMEAYTAARPDIFFTGRDGSMRSNRLLCQMAGQYAVDLFIGATLQMDGLGNSSTVTHGRLTGFGGAPNMGHDPHGRRHGTPAWLDLIEGDDPLARGRKLVVQMVETFQDGSQPTIVESLDAVEVGKACGMPLAPVMIYGDDVTHVLTEEGIAYLYKARSLEERKAMLAAVAGVTPVGLRHDPKRTAKMRQDGLIALPEDIGVQRAQATRSLLAAKSIADLVDWSGGLYEPPAKFRSW
jgi:malonate decarboxylase alpha subunit